MLKTLDPCRLFIMGASGSGTTTLGRAIADKWAIPHADADDYFWRPTSPPYREQRTPVERLSLMREVFVPRSTWVLSGSIMGWGEDLMAKFDAVVFLTLDSETRMTRLRARERIRELELARSGGFDQAARQEFMSWAQGYDNPDFAGRNRSRHEQWLEILSCPILRLETSRPVDELVQAITGQSGVGPTASTPADNTDPIVADRLWLWCCNFARSWWAHADATVSLLPLEASGHMPWWREARNPVSLARILVHVTAETHRHAGHADIVREMADGSVGHRDGNDNMAAGDPAWAPIAALNADRVTTRTLERFLHPDGRLDQDLFLSNSGWR